MRMATLAGVIGVVACGGSSASPDAGATADAPEEGPAGCARTEAPADRDRFVVVSHPYDAAGGQAGGYEVLGLTPAGELSRPDRRFTMGRAVDGSIAFTPDGEIGLVALENGKVGVFRLDAGGVPTVVHAGFAGSFYASRVIVEPRGDRALVLDGNTRENGGGIYLVTIGCDGTLTDHGLVAAAKNPGGAVISGARALVASNDPGASVQMLDWSAAPRPVASVDAFGDDLAIIGGAALNYDGTAFLVGDVSQFSGLPTRIAVVGVDGGLHASLASHGTFPIEDPAAIATSPFGNVAVVASAFGNALFILDDDGPTGWRVRGEVAYAGGRPRLPSDLAPISRGGLRGHVLVSENVSVRHLAFGPDVVRDLGSLAFGSGLDNISGAIGVTP
ncbi:MAG: hypothetical protein KF773_13975 [Deltaproteobacteria bacterium]|nr:hypothetical protein [Deltaproteobacteria bacterium]